MKLAQAIRTDKAYPVYDRTLAPSGYSLIPRVILIDQALCLHQGVEYFTMDEYGVH